MVGRLSFVSRESVNSMSLSVLLHVREGIVLAADSRVVFSAEEQRENGRTAQVSVRWSDSCRKVFLAPGNVGISSFGAAEIGGAPIAGYIESFIREEPDDDTGGVGGVAHRLLARFKEVPGASDVRFFVAGYETENARRVQHVYRVAVAKDQVDRCNQPGVVGATWGGESDVLARLHQPVVVVNDEGQLTQRLAHFPISWRSFTLQDAIDYAIYAIQVTIDSMRFQPRAKTVGGPIDVLVMRPDEAAWIQRKAHRSDG